MLAIFDYNGADERLLGDREWYGELQFCGDLDGGGRHDHHRRSIYPEWHWHGDHHCDFDTEHE
jgi:hypothetical protein